MNTYRNSKVAREPGRNQKAYEASWAPQSQRNEQNKMKFAGGQQEEEEVYFK